MFFVCLFVLVTGPLPKNEKAEEPIEGAHSLHGNL